MAICIARATRKIEDKIYTGAVDIRGAYNFDQY